MPRQKPKGNPNPKNKFGKGNRAAVGHGKWKKVRNWSTVIAELFELLENDPTQLEKILGRSIPEQFKKKDCQLMLVFREFLAAMQGDAHASAEIKRWLDGDPRLRVDIGTEGKSLVDLLNEGRGKVNGGVK